MENNVVGLFDKNNKQINRLEANIEIFKNFLIEALESEQYTTDEVKQVADYARITRNKLEVLKLKNSALIKYII